MIGDHIDDRPTLCCYCCFFQWIILSPLLVSVDMKLSEFIDGVA